MKFTHNNNSIDFHEATGSTIRIAFWNNAIGSYGFVDFGEDGLGKLIDWLRIQEDFMKKQKPKK